MTATIESLKSEVLPALFSNTTNIGQYGPHGGTSSVSLNQLSDVMETGAVSRLAAMIGNIVARLGEADPKILAKKPNFWSKLVGKHIEQTIQYQTARQSLNGLIEKADKTALEVRETIAQLDLLLASHQNEAAALKMHIEAGREFMQENPKVGASEDGVMEFDNPRERFARKLTNLATLYQSHEMSVLQMKLTRAQAIDMLDRYTETASVLVPVWRQHTLALLTTEKMNPAMIAEATKAHGALMNSLSESLKGLEK